MDGVKKETTSSETNKNHNKAKRTKLVDNALPKAKPPEHNNPTIKISPTDTAGTMKIPLRARRTNLYNYQGGANKDRNLFYLTNLSNVPNCLNLPNVPNNLNFQSLFNLLNLIYFKISNISTIF